jgi:DHA3 family tetracycline resistance protein-like MFS transporter
VGDGIFLIAMVWEAYALWNAPAALSVLGIGMTVPTIACLLLGGAISDRFDRRRILLYSDLARALIVGVLAVLLLAGALSFVLLVVLVALDQFIRPVALRMVGPALGGVLVSVLGAGSAFALDAASFLASAAIILALRGRRSFEPEDAPASNVQAIREGFRFVRKHVWLWGTLVSAAIAYLAFLGPTEVLLPYLVKNELHASAGDLGLVFAAQRGHPRRDVTVMYACWTLATVAVAGYGLARSTVELMLACLLFNALEAAGTIIWATIKQVHVPSSLLGRVSSLDWLISIGFLPISFALTAPAADLIGARNTLLTASAIGSIATFAALFIPGMRDIEGDVPSAPPAVAVRPVTAGGV